MKLFKSVDEKFAEIGFVKVEENKYGVTYKRKVDEYDYTQTLALLHKSSGRHLIQSYDADLMDEKKIGNTCVGLTMYETNGLENQKIGTKVKYFILLSEG